jgi:hypothetical protein
MASTSTNLKSQESNSQMAADYLAKMQADMAAAQALIAKIKALFPQLAQLDEWLAIAKDVGDENAVKEIQSQIDGINAQIKDATDQLSALDPGMASLGEAIDTLETGLYTVSADGDANIGEDLQMFSNYLNIISSAMLDKLQADEWKNKMQNDGDDNNALMKDAIEAMKASSAESGTLVGLQTQMGNDLVTLNNQKNDAQTDLDSYRWYDDLASFGTDESDKEHDRAVIENSDDMRKIILGLMSKMAPEMAATQNEIYSTASLSMEKILDKLLKIIMDPSLSPEQKGDQIKCLMALALGILSMIQTDAAQEKAKDQQTEANSANFATKMNISDQKAELQQLQNDLAYAKTMGTLMKIAKAVIEVAGTLLAPGIGSFLVMASLMIADQAGLTDKLTNALAAKLGQVGAEVLVGALEIAGTLGGGAALDSAIDSAVAQVMAVAAQETAVVVEKVVDEAVSKAMAAAETTLGRTLTQAEQKAIEKVVSETVNQAVKSAVQKTVAQFYNQSAATLIPQLLKTAAKEGTANLSTLIAESAEADCITAAKNAAEKAAAEVESLAKMAASGAKVSQAEIETIGNRAADEAVAKVTGSTSENIAKIVDTSAAKRAAFRAGLVAAYDLLNDGAISSGVEAALKKAGLKEDDKSFTDIMAAIKAMEGILASLAMMYGSGVSTASFNASLLSKVGALAQVAGTGAQAIASGGQAEAEMKQANAVQAINESSVSNDMLQMFMQQFNQQGDIDRKNLENQMAEQASNYTMISQLENNSKEAAMVLAQQAV